MKKISSFILSVSTAILLSGCQSTTLKEQTPQTEVIAAMEQVADWQIKNWSVRLDWNIDGKAAEQWPALNWTNAALYVGMLEFDQVTEDKKYINWVKAIGAKNNWQLDLSHGRPYHADDYAVAQSHLTLFQRYKDPAMLTPIKQRLDWILQNPKMGSLKMNPSSKKPKAFERWGWSDALFMAPPVWARMAKITGDKKYLDFMHQEYKATYDYLFDQQDHLFYRDSMWFDSSEKNGEKIYWSRGNGWVFTGLALILQQVPSDWEHREFYVTLYKKMAAKLIETQKTDGSWPMGLLGGVSGYPNKEVSGTGFFTHGLAWGINNDILDKATYQSIVLKGWQALTSSIQPDGMLGYVQPVGASPGESGPKMSEVFGIGAFLAAGSEVYKLLSTD